MIVATIKAFAKVQKARNQWTETEGAHRLTRPTYGNPGVNQISGNNKQKKPAYFDGSSSWQDYQVLFEMVAEINGWDDTTKAVEFETSLRGSAQAIFSDLRPVQRRSYNNLVAALTSRFEPSNQAELYRTQMKNDSWKPIDIT